LAFSKKSPSENFQQQEQGYWREITIIEKDGSGNKEKWVSRAEVPKSNHHNPLFSGND